MRIHPQRKKPPVKVKARAEGSDVATADRERLKGLVISESGFLFDPVTGYTYNLNSTAVDLLGRLQIGKTRREILAEMEQQYQADANDIERDTDQFLSRLEEYGLLVWKKSSHGT